MSTAERISAFLQLATERLEDDIREIAELLEEAKRFTASSAPRS
ncbi:MAG: hypothetical protein ABJE95_31870 [Byssovorax sp.]